MLIKLMYELKMKLTGQSLTGLLERFQRISRAALHSNLAGLSGGDFAADDVKTGKIRGFRAPTLMIAAILDARVCC